MPSGHFGTRSFADHVVFHLNISIDGSAISRLLLINTECLHVCCVYVMCMLYVCCVYVVCMLLKLKLKLK
jgi:hypothetical protein